MESNPHGSAFPTPGPYTWEDFVALADDDGRELDDGHLVEVEAPTKLHEWIVAQLVFFMTGWARAQRAGVVFASGYKVKVRAQRGFMPDVQFFRQSKLHLLDDQGLSRGAPDVAVEVLSPTSRRYDRVRKMTSYAEIGVTEYWIVDGEARTLERLVLQGGHYVVREALEGDTVFQRDALAGLEIPLAELWQLPE